MSRLPREITTTLLLTIFGKGEVTMTQLQKETGFSTITVLNHVEELITANLLEERRETTLPKRRFITLSSEGVRVASMLNLMANSFMDSRSLIDLGAKAGRMAAYREAVSILRPQNVTRDYAIAELLIRDLELLIGSLEMLSRTLPPEMVTTGKALTQIGEKLDVKVKEARKSLEGNDIRRSAEVVRVAWKDYGAGSKEIEVLLGKLKEKKIYDLSKIIEFIAPIPAQKG